MWWSMRQTISLLDTPMAIPAFANRVMGHVGQYWLGVGLLLAGCATINTLMAAVPRIIYGMALDGALPRFLTWLHPALKHRSSPSHSVLRFPVYMPGI